MVNGVSVGGLGEAFLSSSTNLSGVLLAEKEFLNGKFTGAGEALGDVKSVI